MTEPLLDRLPEVAREIGGAAHFLLGLDFDGTLAPIVSDPAEARMPDETRSVVRALASNPRISVAVVSGRAPEDLRARLGLDVIVAGNHGLEIVENGSYWSHPKAAKWQPALRGICSELAARTRDIRGTLVEDKGLTASVHFRNVAEEDQPAIEEIVTALVPPDDHRFFVRQGKKVFEILPRVRWDKGAAILQIAERITNRLRETRPGKIALCYIGDDATDESAFRQLPGALTIRVGKNCPTGARFRVRDTAHVFKFLNWLQASRLPAESADSPVPAFFPPRP